MTKTQINIDKKNNTVYKTYNLDRELYFYNELTCLKILRDSFEGKFYSVFPFPEIKTIDYDNLTFTMTYCGLSVKDNVNYVPNNIIDQLNNVFYNLKRCNILYKDIHPENVCINSTGNVFLIDFEVAFIMDFENYNNVITFERGSYKWSNEYYNKYYDKPGDLSVFNNLNFESEKRLWKGSPWSIVRMFDNII